MKRLLYAVITSLAAAACSQQPAPVPRRTAYPRIEPYPDSTVTAVVGTVSFGIPAGTDTAHTRPGWLDIGYPRYHATTLITVRHTASAAELKQALANRRQRMELNLGDRTAASEEFDNGNGFSCQLIVSLDGGPTPVQMLAVDTAAGILLSGASVISGPSEPADSVGPTVDTLADDARTLLKTITVR